MLFLSLLALLGVFLIIYQIFFTKQIYKFILKVQGDKNHNSIFNEEACYSNLLKYKIIHYLLCFLLLLVSFLLIEHLELKAWINLYYIEWLLCCLYMKLNFSFLTHFLNVKFIPRELETIEKEYVIGCVKLTNNQCLLKYRILNKKISI